MSQTDENRQHKRRQPPWKLSEDQWLVAKGIAKQLGETEKLPRSQIARIIRFCGVAFAEQTLQEALAVEANGGMLTASGDRGRTPGGVFFFLAQEKMTKKQRYQVFAPRQPKPAADQTTAENTG
jgi:hypothetical protein